MIKSINVTSNIVLLLVFLFVYPSECRGQIPILTPDGYATQNGGTTGGSDAEPVTVSTAAAFQSAVDGITPAVVIVDGRINVGDVVIDSNKTIIGMDTTSGLFGGTIGVRGTNYIFQNLSIGPAEGDVFEVSGATNVFVTKCDFFGSTDELCSIVREADFVTVSWSKFYFDDPDGHSFAHLIGNSDGATGDRGKLHVTLHHNWYDDGVRGRMPRVRFGHVHIYNNYYNSNNTDYCIGVGHECHIRVENTHFDDVEDAWADYGGTENGEIGWAGLKFTNTPQPTFVSNSFPVFSPPYPYTMNLVDDVQALLTDPTYGAGNKLSLSVAPDTDPPTPDPLTWASEPAAVSESGISMTATTASDLSGVEYYFANQTDVAHDSGWQDSPTYIDSGLSPSTMYTYTVRARDKNVSRNEGEASPARSATTLEADSTPPTPDPMTWSMEPQASDASVTMTATTASDPSGVEYYFANLTDPSHDSGWQSSPSYFDFGLQLSTEYTYTVRTRDMSLAQNQTEASTPASATTSDVAPIHINFQPDDSDIPDGFIADFGDVFGDRGNGMFYGWNTDHTDQPRERGVHPELEYDTIMHIEAGGIWEMAVANGEYNVEVTVGDPHFDSTHTINVEGVSYWNGEYLGTNVFSTQSMNVVVSDGRITLDTGDGADRATRICFLTVTPLSAEPEAAVNSAFWIQF